SCNLLASLPKRALIEELVFEERPRGGIQREDTILELALMDAFYVLLHQLSQRVDGRAGDGEHEANDECEGGALLSRHLRRQGPEDVVIEFDDFRLDLFPDVAR